MSTSGRSPLRILFLITARAGSKGVPRKNLQEIDGLSLIGYKAVSARRSRYCARLIISTESVEIQEHARQLGIEVPFTRPDHLATDAARSIDVVLHAVEWIESNTNERYDALLLLEPAAPFSRTTDYDAAAELMVEQNANVVVGVRAIAAHSIFAGPLDEQGRIVDIVKKINGLSNTRRQDLPQEYTMNGALYLIRWEYLKRARAIYSDPNTTYGLPMDPHHSVEIDSEIDLHWAQFLAAKGYVDTSEWLTQR